MKLDSMREEHQKYMDFALKEAEKALADGEFPVGCVMVHNGKVVATGGRENSGPDGNEFDHAEIVAMRNLLETDDAPDFGDVVVYSTLEPCLMCFSTLILNGFRTIVYGYEDVMGGGSGLELSRLPSLYASMDVKIIPGVRRDSCLDLFQHFFKNDANDYWRNSLLSHYTLEQE